MILAVLAAAGLAACGGSGSSPEPPRAAEIVISPQSATFTYIGEKISFSATVRDQNGRPFSGAVNWSGSDDSVFTVDASGEATAVSNGSGTVTASISGLSADASVTVEQAASDIEIVSGAGQTQVFGQALPQPVVVRALDAGGAPVGGISVNFRPQPGHGAADPESAQTAMDGTASTTWTLGDDIGEQTLSASAGGDATAEITAEVVRSLPRLVNPELPDAYAGLAYSARLRAESGSGSGYSWAPASGNLPAGLALAADGEISGVAERADAYEFEVRVTDGAGASQAAMVRLRICEGPLELETGEFRQFSPTSKSHCGFVLRASEAGEYYRVTLVAPAREHRPTESVALDIATPGNEETSVFERIRARMFAGGAIAALSPGPKAAVAAEDPHLEHLAGQRRNFSVLAARGELRPLPDLRRRGVATTPPPEIREFTRGSPGTLEDNCRLSETRTGELIAFNDHVAFYAEPDITPPLNRDNVRIVADFYRDYGVPVINEYFGGVNDVDGDGRVTAFLDSELGRIAGVVWLGDLLSKDDCASSNEAELVRLNRGWVEFAYRGLTGTLVHEVQHVSSGYQNILRNGSNPPLEVFSTFEDTPLWMEEGKSEIAKEMASRLAWEALGGPLPDHRVTRSDLLAYDIRSPDLHGILYVLASIKQALSGDIYALRYHPYGAGWHFLRFLGDWRGNPSGISLGDAGLFRELNDSMTPGGIGGIERVTGASWEDLMTEYAIAASLAGTTAAPLEGVPNFRTYDFTGLNIEDFFFEHPGRYPWPATTSDEGGEAVLWAPLGVSRRVEGRLASNGLRIHDFRADAAGDTAIFRVEAPPNARAIVVRIPDQAQ